MYQLQEAEKDNCRMFPASPTNSPKLPELRKSVRTGDVSELPTYFLTDSYLSCIPDDVHMPDRLRHTPQHTLFSTYARLRTPVPIFTVSYHLS